MTHVEDIVVGSHQWKLVERLRSLLLFIVSNALFVVAYLTSEKWLLALGITFTAAFAYTAVTSGRVVHINRERIQSTGPLGIRTMNSRDIVEVAAADDPLGSVILVFRSNHLRTLSIPLRIIEEHPEGIVALHQFIDHAIGSGRLDPARVSLKNELVF